MVRLEQVEVAALLGFGMILIALGVDLCKEGQYETGVVLVVVGLGLLLAYYVLSERRMLKWLSEGK